MSSISDNSSTGSSSNYAQAFSDLGGAVSDIFGGKGAAASASSYTEAATITTRNEQLAQQATKIKQTQQQRQIYQTIGAQKADIGGAGMSNSGTALDLLRSSASQGALTQAMTTEQGQIQSNTYAEQAQQYTAMANAANSSSSGMTIGGAIQIAGAIAAL